MTYGRGNLLYDRVFSNGKEDAEFELCLNKLIETLYSDRKGSCFYSLF